jgi:hemolysin activation/secretion protein
LKHLGNKNETTMSPKMTHPILHSIVGSVFAVLTLTVSAADNADNPIGRFDITRFEVAGNTLLAKPAIDQLLTPYTGKNRDFGDVQRALETLEAAYRQRGYSVVQVVLPEQELNQGVVHFRVVETRIGKISVEGNKFFDQDNIRRSLPGIRIGETPRIGKISASLKVANENPAKKTTLQLQSGDKDDEITAALHVVDEKPWSVGLNVDNAGDQKTGSTHVGVVYQHANVAGLDHVLSLQYTTTIEKPSQVSVYGAGYHIPLYAYGDSLDLFASYSDVDSGTVAAGIFDLQVSGKGSVFGIRYNQNMKRIGDYESKLVYGMDYKAFKNNVQLVGVPAQLGNDVTVHPLSVGYIGTWTLPAGEAGYYLTASHNIPGGDHGDAAAFKSSGRANASPEYSILRYGANYSRVLARDWQLRINVNGQYTHDELISGEQFGVGGASSVRGFHERDTANDYGYAGSVEMYTPNLCAGINFAAVQCRALAFYDGAHVSRVRPLPLEQSQASLSSAGIGLRASINKFFSMQMDYGQVIDASDAQTKGDKRLHIKVALSY